jgi:hypothetical protein
MRRVHAPTGQLMFLNLNYVLARAHTRARARDDSKRVAVRSLYG